MKGSGNGRAVVLLSGGLDSATALYIALDAGFRVHALSFGYGQVSLPELRAAALVAERAGVEDHVVSELDPRLFSGSSLTGRGKVPDGDPGGDSGGIPSTYVPARNTVFLAMALALAESIGSRDVFIGVNSVDYSGYPDCRPEFLEAFRRLAELATREGVEGRPIRIRAPLLDMSKGEIIRKGLALGVDYSLTLSCYRPDDKGRHCGSCDSCILRLGGFREAGVPDPAPYRG